MNGRRAILACAAVVCTMTGVLSPRAGQADTWSYTLHEPRAGQQANLCRERGEALRLARIFERQGPRPGYEALTQSPQCRTRVVTFTPRAVLRRVIISEGAPGEYAVSFVEVRTAGGETAYLVTTRRVRP